MITYRLKREDDREDFMRNRSLFNCLGLANLVLLGSFGIAIAQSGANGERPFPRPPEVPESLAASAAALAGTSANGMVPASAVRVGWNYVHPSLCQSYNGTLSYTRRPSRLGIQVIRFFRRSWPRHVRTVIRLVSMYIATTGALTL
jgi:hypothetical protein